MLAVLATALPLFDADEVAVTRAASFTFEVEAVEERPPGEDDVPAMLLVDADWPMPVRLV